ncbi:ADP-glyceromanno-heptose 6-epimerase [Deferribacterales bacterium RsTz2092]|nr:ADP-L-glycero-D-manno-heptose-6-epimerase [Deferribacterales bacterium]
MILVTGGAGFIGSNIVRGFNKRGVKDILLTDDLTFGCKHRNLNRLEFVDYMDYRELMSNISKLNITHIIHQGACSDTTEPDGRFMMDTNYEYSKKLLAYCSNNSVPFIYASSASVYGDGKAGFRESPECEYPLNVYAFSKCQFDRYYRLNADKLRSQVVGLRYFNVYGPQENHKGKMASVASHLFQQVKANEPMKLFEGSADILRDFIHVDDVVNVNLFFFDHPELSGIFNCGTGRAESFEAIARAVQAKYSEASLEYMPFPDELQGKYQRFTQADLTNLRAAGYADEFLGVASGVARYLDVLENSDGYLV